MIGNKDDDSKDDVKEPPQEFGLVPGLFSSTCLNHVARRSGSS